MSPPDTRNAPSEEGASQNIGTARPDEDQPNRVERQNPTTCNHTLGTLAFRSELGHWDGLFCAVCADRHLERELQEDWGLCGECGDMKADRHWPGSATPEMVDGRLVYVKVVCVYRCVECAI